MHISYSVERQRGLSFDLFFFFFFAYFITFKNCSYSIFTYFGPSSTFSRREGNHPCLEYRCQRMPEQPLCNLGRAALGWVP